MDKEKRRTWLKEYLQRPEVKAKRKAYHKQWVEKNYEKVQQYKKEYYSSKKNKRRRRLYYKKWLKKQNDKIKKE